MTKTELQAKIELFRRELNELQMIKVSCRTCEHGASGGWCSKFQAAPPEEVQQAGCDDWSFDSIPF